MVVLYIAFAGVTLWLLGETLMQRGAAIHWRVLALLGFLCVVVGTVASSSVPIILGLVLFAVGQVFVTLQVRGGEVDAWGMDLFGKGRGRGGAGGGRQPAAAQPRLHASAVEEEGEGLAGGPAGGSTERQTERTAAIPLFEQLEHGPDEGFPGQTASSPSATGQSVTGQSVDSDGYGTQYTVPEQYAAEPGGYQPEYQEQFAAPQYQEAAYPEPSFQAPQFEAPPFEEQQYSGQQFQEQQYPGQQHQEPAFFSPTEYQQPAGYDPVGSYAPEGYAADTGQYSVPQQGGPPSSGDFGYGYPPQQPAQQPYGDEPTTYTPTPYDPYETGEQPYPR